MLLLYEIFFNFITIYYLKTCYFNQLMEDCNEEINLFFKRFFTKNSVPYINISKTEKFDNTEEIFTTISSSRINAPRIIVNKVFSCTAIVDNKSFELKRTYHQQYTKDVAGYKKFLEDSHMKYNVVYDGKKYEY